MHIFRAHPRSVRNFREGPSNLCLNKHPRWFWSTKVWKPLHSTSNWTNPTFQGRGSINEGGVFRMDFLIVYHLCRMYFLFFAISGDAQIIWAQSSRWPCMVSNGSAIISHKSLHQMHREIPPHSPKRVSKGHCVRVTKEVTKRLPVVNCCCFRSQNWLWD